MEKEMKTVKVLLFLMAACVMTANAQDKKQKTETVCFEVSMNCHNCQNKIEKNLSWEKGVKDLKVALEDKTVTIVYDTRKTSDAKLKKAIEELGFTCKIKEKSK